MANISIHFFSTSLCGFTSVQVILPNDVPPQMRQGNPHYQRPTKTLYLLHGYSGAEHDWMMNTQIGQLAGQYNLAVVCPRCGNNFYLDGPETGRQYATYVGKELPAYIHSTFSLSENREDVFIGGFSMGGFGAIHTALAYPEKFSKVLSFSAALIHHNVEAMKPDSFDPIANYAYYRMVFGEPEALPQSPNNPEFLLKQLRAQGKQIPDIFQCIGTEDFLYGENQIFRQFLTEQEVPFVYQEASGVHDFVTVGKFLEQGLKFLTEG